MREGSRGINEEAQGALNPMSLYRKMRDDWERETLQAALKEYGSPKLAAKALGLNRTHFHRKLVELGLREPKHKAWIQRPGNWAMFGL